MQKYLMGIDVGTGGGRCFIFDIEGNQISSSYHEWNHIYPKNVPEGVEINADDMWEILCRCIRDALAQGRTDPDDIAAVSSTSMRQGIVLLDDRGKEIYAGPNIDMRADKEARAVEGAYGDRIYKITGQWPIGMLAPFRLLWLKKHKPADYKRVKTFLMLNDWVLYRLSGRAISEPSNATSSALLDLRKIKWSDEIIELLRLPFEIFPDIQENGIQVGEVSTKSAIETGLREGTPTVTGGADTQCGLIGTAAVREGQATIVAGTTSPIQLVVSRPIISSKRDIWTNRHAIPGLWVLESNSLLTGSGFRWFRDALAFRWRFQRFRDAVVMLESPSAEEQGIDVYSLIDKKVERTPIGSHGVIAVISSVMHARRSFTARPSGAIFGIRTTRPDLSGKKEIARAIMENTCFASLGNIIQLEEASRLKIKEVRFCGGAARSKIWTRIQADVLGIPIRIPKVNEATALGVSICAGAGVGIYKTIMEGVKKTVKWKPIEKPDLKAHKEYKQLYPKWRKLHDTVLDLSEAGIIPPW